MVWLHETKLIVLRSRTWNKTIIFTEPNFTHIHTKSTIEFYTNNRANNRANNKPLVCENINTIISEHHAQSIRDFMIPQRSRRGSRYEQKSRQSMIPVLGSSLKSMIVGSTCMAAWQKRLDEIEALLKIISRYFT